ncbi:MAG: tRNA uridine-5-carboxymethylaminomethyl(34) synthesis GTPase MnmE [Sulfitobacter sp.]
MDTIFAEGTAKGRAGVSVVRISGISAKDTAIALCGSLPAPRVAGLRNVTDEQSELIDQALVLWFPAPHSFTGEDVVELHLHGSVAVVAAVYAELSRQIRMAEPGEFTRRALENGKLDLAQIEGLADLIDAETEAQRKQAVRLLDGALGDKVDVWRRDLIRAAALLEATIDFADEDVPVDVSDEVSDLIARTSSALDHEIAGVKIAERIRTGFEVAIIGPPNAGKSTLLNRLAGRQAAITSNIAGTTRDVIEVRMDIHGLAVTILDTAGLREATDSVEKIGVDLAVSRARAADLRVVLQEGGFKAPFGLNDDDIVLVAKSDVVSGGVQGVSGLTGAGVDQLVDRISQILSTRSSSAGLATRERHRVAMTKTVEGLSATVDLLASGPDMYDLAAEELRHACRALDALVGRIDVENLLDEIFSSFCLGK